MRTNARSSPGCLTEVQPVYSSFFRRLIDWMESDYGPISLLYEADLLEDHGMGWDRMLESLRAGEGVWIGSGDEDPVLEIYRALVSMVVSDEF